MIPLNKSNKEKGMVLILTFLVASILLIFTAGFFLRALNERRLINLRMETERALQNAEKGIAYAYFESAQEGWTWFTHQWNNGLGRPQPLASPPSANRSDVHFVSVSDDPCGFLKDGESGSNPTADPDYGCYAANDCTFVLKTFSDPLVKNMTVVRVKGISGNVVRTLEYRISRSAIYDYAWWTNYDLRLNSIGGYVNGGRIHANGNIFMESWIRLLGVDTISTGKDKGIYYAWSNYYAPGYYDWYIDGSSNINGRIPLPSLEKANVFLGGSAYVKSWAGTTADLPITTQAPWVYLDNNIYKYRGFAWEYGVSSESAWPPGWILDEEFRFYGDSDPINNTKANRYSWVSGT
ncbi:MAG: hypothetical protein NC912_00945, partial [Candidatus Omnitrophica bacterium]|nr:hypothetical protein [Candidatus Omnitrophota bacterium]